MEKPCSVATIFFPSSHKFSSGFLVGFNYRGFLTCVVDIIPLTTVSTIESLLSKASADRCGLPNSQKMILLGQLLNGTDETSTTQGDLLSHKQSCDIWIEIRKTDTYKLGYDIEPNLIMYDTRPQCYLSAKPFSNIFDLAVDNASSTPAPYGLDSILEIINLQSDLSQMLHAELAEIYKEQNMTMKELDQKSCTENNESKLFTKFCRMLVLMYLGVEYVLCFIIFWIFYIPQIIPIPGYTSLNYLVRNIDKRLKDTKSCMRYMKELIFVNQKLGSGELIQVHGSQYKLVLLSKTIKLYSKLSQLFFDFALGIFVLVMAFFYYADVLIMLHTFGARLHIDRLRSNVDWLMGFPSGFKPNIELDQFIGKLLLTVFDYWNYFTSYATIAEPAVVIIVGFVGLLGCTFQLGLARDILSICALHIHYIYTGFIQVYRLIVSVMSTLFKIFSGKRYNSIKKRTVSAEYSYEEVVMGSLIFTLILFLLPTVFMFYLSFSYLYCIIIVAHVILAVLEALVANFPSYALLHWILNPYAFPSRISVDVDTKKSLILLNTKPVPILALFYKMIQKLTRVVKGVNPARLVKGFFKGESLFTVVENITANKGEDKEKAEKESVKFTELLGLILKS